MEGSRKARDRLMEGSCKADDRFVGRLMSGAHLRDGGDLVERGDLLRECAREGWARAAVGVPAVRAGRQVRLLHEVVEMAGGGEE